MQKGIITIEIENISAEETARYQDILHNLITQGALNIFNGSANIHFRSGVLESIDINLYTYKRNKNNTPLQINKNVVKTLKDLPKTTMVV